MFRSASILGVTLAVGGLLLAAAPASAVSGRPQVPTALGWHVAKSIAGPNFPGFSAVAATSATGAWAFEAAGSSAAAYKLSGSTWTKSGAFPAKAGDSVLSASASAASNVWAFTFKGAVLRYNGSSWATVKKFAKSISSGLAVSPTSVWVFGQQFSGTGTWHFNGSTWTKSASGAGLYGASALSDNNIWAYGGTSVAHWNGSTWKKTSLASLLPKNTQLSHSFLAGVYAQSPKSVYVAASGGRQDEGGPLVLLHYNGSKWSRLVLATKLGGPVAIVPDGSGGLWIPVSIAQGQASMERYAHGALHSAVLPFSPAHLTLLAASTAPGTTFALTVGFTRKSFSSTTSTAVILRYGS